jgi:hypothetical protein
MNIKINSIIRLIYESGWLSEELVGIIFFPQTKNGDLNKRYWTKRRNAIRRYMNHYIEKGLIVKKLIDSYSNFQYDYGYFLTKKGYGICTNGLKNMEKGSIRLFNKSEKNVIKRYDPISEYRHLKKIKFKEEELSHYDFIIRMKILLGQFLGKRIIVADLLSKNDLLFTEDRLDLIIEIGSNKFIGIEYERTIKTKERYVGYKKWFGYNHKTYPGMLRKRNNVSFFGKGRELLYTIFVCENKTILKKIMTYIQDIMTPNRTIKHEMIDRIFLIDKSRYKNIKEMVLSGHSIYCRIQNAHGKTDFITKKLRDLICGRVD